MTYCYCLVFETLTIQYKNLDMSELRDFKYSYSPFVLASEIIRIAHVNKCNRIKRNKMHTH